MKNNCELFELGRREVSEGDKRGMRDVEHYRNKAGIWVGASGVVTAETAWRLAELKTFTPRPAGYQTMRAAIRVGVTTVVLTEGVWRTLSSKEKKVPASR